MSKVIDDNLLDDVNGGMNIPLVSNLMKTNDTEAELLHPMATDKNEYEAIPLLAGSPQDPVSHRQKNDLMRKVPGEAPRLIKC